MTRKDQKHVTRRQMDSRVEPFRSMKWTESPRSGWIRAIRDGLGMTRALGAPASAVGRRGPFESLGRRMSPFQVDDSATPLSPDECNGLLPQHITLRQELNELEAANILAADLWAFGRRKKTLLSEKF